MRNPNRGAVCALSLLVLTARPSLADEPGDARSLYALGKAAYDRGDYQGALTEFSRAYALRPAPALLFDMAQASRLSGEGHCAEALDLYERYLERDPASENGKEVAERIVQMRTCTRERGAAATVPGADGPPSSPPTAPEANPGAPRTATRASVAATAAPAAAVAPASASLRSGGERRGSSRPPPLAAVLATGIGASLAVAGGVLYLRARSTFAAAQTACPCPEGTYGDGETLTRVSYALMATGAVVSGTGAAFWILSGTSDSGEARVNGAGLRFSARF